MLKGYKLVNIIIDGIRGSSQCKLVVTSDSETIVYTSQHNFYLNEIVFEAKVSHGSSSFSLSRDIFERDERYIGDQIGKAMFSVLPNLLAQSNKLECFQSNEEEDFYAVQPGFGEF